MPDISEAPAQVVESLDGTRTSRRWAERPGSFDTVNARAVYPSSNEYGIPDLPCAEGKPARLVPYSDRHIGERAKPGDCCHYFSRLPPLLEIKIEIGTTRRDD